MTVWPSVRPYEVQLCYLYVGNAFFFLSFFFSGRVLSSFDQFYKMTRVSKWNYFSKWIACQNEKLLFLYRLLYSPFPTAPVATTARIQVVPWWVVFLVFWGWRMLCDWGLGLYRKRSSAVSKWKERSKWRCQNEWTIKMTYSSWGKFRVSSVLGGLKTRHCSISFIFFSGLPSCQVVD